MTNSYEDFLGSFTLESPDFKRALKILIKYEIHVLLQRLSDTGEESVVITASIDDRTNGHLGSQKGRSFLRETQIKALEEQFLSYCTGQCYEQRTEVVDNVRRAKHYVREREEETSRYDVHETKDSNTMENDRNSGHCDTMLVQDTVYNRIEQSEDCISEGQRQETRRMARLLSKFDENREIIGDCYGENSLAGRCNDVCCRGSYLDLVGPFIRPAIPSIDKSSYSTNKDDDSIAESDSQSYVREQSYYDVVDLTVDRTERSIRDTGNRKSIADTETETSSNGKNVATLPELQQQVLQHYERNDITGGKSDLVFNEERLNVIGAVNKPNHSETIVPNQLTLVKSKSETVISGQTSALETELDPELEALMSNEIDTGNKRKFCSRVPECKLRSLLEADSNSMPNFIGNKMHFPVKQEPCLENELEMQRCVKAITYTSKFNGQGRVEREMDVTEKQIDPLKLSIKKEDPPSSTEEQFSKDTGILATGRSLRFLCRYCGESFKNKQYRELHEKLHLTQHRYVCESCGSGFDEESIYEEHSKIHITHPLLKCESCGYRTSRKFRMNSHREICGKPSKVFTCPYCQKPFLAKRYMKVHMKSHDLANVHHCPYCVNTYPLKNSLLKHVKSKHKRF